MSIVLTCKAFPSISPLVECGLRGDFGFVLQDFGQPSASCSGAKAGPG